MNPVAQLTTPVDFQLTSNIGGTGWHLVQVVLLWIRTEATILPSALSQAHYGYRLARVVQTGDHIGFLAGSAIGNFNVSMGGFQIAIAWRGAIQVPGQSEPAYTGVEEKPG